MSRHPFAANSEHRHHAHLHQADDYEPGGIGDGQELVNHDWILGVAVSQKRGIRALSSEWWPRRPCWLRQPGSGNGREPAWALLSPSVLADVPAQMIGEQGERRKAKEVEPKPIVIP